MWAGDLACPAATAYAYLRTFPCSFLSAHQKFVIDFLHRFRTSIQNRLLQLSWPDTPISSIMTVGSAPLVLIDKQYAPIYIVTINRAHVKNAVDRPTARQLHAAFVAFAQDDAV